MEVENFQGFISPQISEVVFQNRCGPETWAGISQHFEDILRSFKLHLDNLERVPVELSEFGLTTSFENHEFLVRKRGEVLIRERLPTVFGMHPMRLGIDTLGDNPVIMVANKSRASTGRYFVALYAIVSDLCHTHGKLLPLHHCLFLEFKAALTYVSCNKPQERK